jgi:hypothetical protein
MPVELSVTLAATSNGGGLTNRDGRPDWGPPPGCD